MRPATFALIGVAGVAAGWLWLRGDAPDGSPLRFDWPAGMRDTYALRWHSSDRAVVAGMDQPLTGELELVGELALTSLGRRGDVVWLAASLPSLTTHHVSMMGQDVLPDAAAARANLVDQVAYLELEANGTLRSIRFGDGASELSKHVMQGLFSELQIALAPGGERAWQTTMATMHGLADVAYEREGRTLTRTRTGYRSLRAVPAAEHVQISERGTGHITLGDGILERLDDSEQLAATHDGQPRVTAELALELVHLRRDRPATLAALPAHLEERHPGEPVVSAEAERRLLDQRIAGLTLEGMKTDLWDHANDGAMPDDHGWFSRATGYVIAHPEAAAQLAALFVDPHFDSVGRRLILDVLSAAGHPAAQAALRTALTSPEARGDAHYTMMLQRLSLVERPTAETAAFVEATMRSGDHAVRAASAVTLGAVAGHLAAQGEAALARRYNDVLVSELSAAGDPASQGELLRAIGNVGSADNRALVLGHVGDADPGVRSAAASALRKDGSATAHQALIGMTEDDSGLVQQAALSSLLRQPLAPAEVSALASAATRAKLAAANQPLVVDLLATRLDQPAALDALRQLADLAKDSQLKARINSLLASR